MEILTLLIAVGGIVAVVLYFRKTEMLRMDYAFREKAFTQVLPNRLQAYERLAIYIERITPKNMVPREVEKVATNAELHVLLLNSIRQEFEHNTAMQIYITPPTWDAIVKAKDEVIDCITEEAKLVQPKNRAVELGTYIVGAAPKKCDFYTKRALDLMRRDIGSCFNHR